MATTISINGSAFKIFKTDYARKQMRGVSDVTTLTGALSRTENGVFRNLYSMTLVCASADVTNLRTLYSLSASTGASSNLLDFTDAEGLTWSASAGVGGGAYFTGDITVSPLMPSGWSRSMVKVNIVTRGTKMNAC